MGMILIFAHSGPEVPELYTASKMFLIPCVDGANEGFVIRKVHARIRARYGEAINRGEHPISAGHVASAVMECAEENQKKFWELISGDVLDGIEIHAIMEKCVSLTTVEDWVRYKYEWRF